MIINGIILSLLNALLIGLSIQKFMGKAENKAIYIFNSLFLGLGMVSALFWLYIITSNGQYTKIYPLFEVLFGSVLWILSERKRKRLEKIPLENNTESFSYNDCIAIIVIILSAIYTSLYVVAFPYGKWDAYSMWNVKAGFLANGNEGVWLKIFDDVFAHAHRDYPLGLCCLVARGFVFAENSFWVPRLYCLFFSISCLALIYLYLRKIKNSFYGIIGLLLLDLNGNFVYQGSKQYADILLAVFVLLVFYELFCWSDSDRKKIPILAFVYLNGCLWTKNEGIPFAIFCLIYIITTMAKFTKKNVLLLGVALISVFILPVSVKVLCVDSNDIVGRVGERLGVLLDLKRYYIVCWAFADILKRHLWLLLWFVMIYFTKKKKWENYLKLLMIPFGGYAVYFFVYVLTPYNVVWHINTSLPRIFIHYAPALVFLIGAIASRLECFDKQAKNAK